MWNEALFLIIGLALGAAWREIRELQWHIADLFTRVTPTAKPGATLGVYNPASEHKQTAGIVQPKSPALVEYEANLRTLQENGMANIIDRSIRPR